MQISPTPSIAITHMRLVSLGSNWMGPKFPFPHLFIQYSHVYFFSKYRYSPTRTLLDQTSHSYINISSSNYLSHLLTKCSNYHSFWSQISHFHINTPSYEIICQVLPTSRCIAIGSSSGATLCSKFPDFYHQDKIHHNFNIIHSFVISLRL